jgi:two-component system, NtrC family, response regulator HydG
MKILVVDDDRDFAESLANVLELGGHRITQVFTGEAAIARLTHDGIDLAFVDIALPKLGGIDALRVVHNLRPGMRIVLMTGHNADQYAQEARMFGAVEILQKPFDSMQLLDRIESLVQEPSQQ